MIFFLINPMNLIKNKLKLSIMRSFLKQAYVYVMYILSNAYVQKVFLKQKI